jgi:hypothetical protein
MWVQWECGCDGVILANGDTLVLYPCDRQDDAPPFALGVRCCGGISAKAHRELSDNERTALLHAINAVLSRGSRMANWPHTNKEEKA